MTRRDEGGASGLPYRQATEAELAEENRRIEEARSLRLALEAAEKARRRERTEQGRSPAQVTPRSENKARRGKLPGKGQRSDWLREVEQ